MDKIFTVLWLHNPTRLLISRFNRGQKRTLRLHLLLPGMLFLMFSIRANAQTVQGTVFDEQNRLPVSGANVTAGASGVVTDTAGHFEINAAAGATLSVTHLNYSPNTYQVSGGETNIEIYLKLASGALTDVVVQGFTKKSRSLVTGASTVITADDIKDVPAASVTELLQGKVAGVNIQNTSGMPGARGSIFQRGLSNINVTGDGNNAYLASGQPLFIIDGVPIDPNEDTEYGFAQAGGGANPLSVIPPEDIESVEILKDAASTSVYGSRGANGVWIINTKRGRSKVPQITYDGKYIYTAVPPLREVYGGHLERQIKVNQVLYNNAQTNNAFNWGLATVNANYFLSDSLNPYLNNSVNWQSYFFGPQLNHSHNLRFAGGMSQFDYKVNLNYMQDMGIIKNTGYKRYSAGINSQYQSENKKIRMLTSVNAASELRQNGSGVGLLQTGVGTSGMASTLLPPPNVYTENNTALASFILKDDNKKNTLGANLDLTYEIAKDLRFRSTGSITFNTTSYNIFYPGWLNYGYTQYNTQDRSANTYYNLNMLQYTRRFLKEKHTVSAYVFSDLNVNKSKTTYAQLPSTPNNFISGPFGYDLRAAVYGTLGEPTDVRQFGYGANVAYDYMQKYVFNASFRFDGTSINGPLTGFNHNPMISFRWNLYKEKFAEGWSSWMNSSSIRASWGQTIVPQGNIFMVYGQYYPGASYNGQPSVLNNFGTEPNAYYKPITNRMTNIGYEGEFFDRRLTIQYDFYYKFVQNNSLLIDVPYETGYSKYPSNDVSWVDYGHELTLNVRPLPKDSKLSWTFGLVGAFNRNILTRLPNDAREWVINPGDQLNLPLLYRLGRSSFSNYLFVTKGVYARNTDVPVDPATNLPMRINGVYLQAGDPIFADLNGDYVIDNRDRVAVGNPVPKLTGGISNFLAYHNFTFNIFTSFTFFRDVLNTPLAYKFQQFYNPLNSTLSGVQAVPPIEEYNYWKAPGDNAVYPNPYTYDHNTAISAFRYNQTLFQEDGSYFKINSITLGYDFRKEMLKRLHLQVLRVFLTGSNVATISNYSGPSPEVITDLGRDNPYGYPLARRYTLGVTVTF